MYLLLAVVPVIYTSRENPEEKLRALKRSMSQQQQHDAKGFAATGSSAAAQGRQEPGPSGSGIGNSEVSLTEQDRKWRLEPSAVAEWEVRPSGATGCGEYCVPVCFMPWDAVCTFLLCS
eukprot:GHRQ01032188.1.p1 GENE.GHRQ01032188.1~~GHRQ01032188.1.p1  ORF type:complete len:119 (-),score=36.27 GHRQ01032188.1:343-699(-)